MRKMYRRKRRSCGVCKPNKKGVTKRWSSRDETLILEFERERKRWLGREQP